MPAYPLLWSRQHCESISELISHKTPSLLGFALWNLPRPIIHMVSISIGAVDTCKHSQPRHVQALIVIGRHHHSHRHSTIPSAILDLIVEAVDGFILLSTISRYQVFLCSAPYEEPSLRLLLSTICRHQVFYFAQHH